MTNEQKENSADQSKVPTNNHNKLLEFQQRVSAISKDSVNPFFKSKYFDVNTVIDTIKPILNEVGLVVIQPFETTGERNILKTHVMDGDKVLIYSSILLPDITDVQKFGAAITYFRRYALVSLLLLQGEEDDDGNRTQNMPTGKAIPVKDLKLPKELQEVAETSKLDLTGKDYDRYAEKMNKSTNLKELEAWANNIKFLAKTLTKHEKDMLRDVFKKKKAELEIITEEYPQ